MCECKKVLSAKRRCRNPHNMRVSGTFKKIPPGGRQACTSCAMMMAREYPERPFMSTQTVHRPGRRTRTCPGGAASPAVPYPVRKAAAPLTEYGCTKKHCRDCRPNSVICVGCGDCRLRIQIYICGGRTRSHTILFSLKKRIAYRERFVKSRRTQTSIFCTQKSLFFCG